MSLPRLGKAARMKKIKELYPLHASVEEMAAACGVNEKTIDRDLKQWKQGGGFEEWLQQEFFSLHKAMKGDDKAALAYSTVAQLLGKSMTQKVQQQIEGGTDVKIVVEYGEDPQAQAAPRPDEGSKK